MLEQDYLMRIILQFAEILRRSWFMSHEKHDPKAAAEMLENAVGEATDIDGGTLLSLSPESIASIMQVSGVDPRVTEYIARSLLLTSGYLHEAGEHDLANLRESQARAVARAYDIELPETWEDLSELLDQADADLMGKAEDASGMLGLSPEDLVPPSVTPREVPLDDENDPRI